MFGMYQCQIERQVCGDGGGVGRLRGDKAASEDAEERRRVEGVVAAEETVVCDDATEAGASEGGAGEVRGRVEVEEDLPEGIVGEVRKGLEAARSWLRTPASHDLALASPLACPARAGTHRRSSARKKRRSSGGGRWKPWQGGAGLLDGGHGGVALVDRWMEEELGSPP